MTSVKITQEDFKNATSCVDNFNCPLACALTRLKIPFDSVSGDFVTMKDNSLLKIKGVEDLKYAFICQETFKSYTTDEIDLFISRAKAGQEVPTIQLYLYD